jgi:hypothetical protein
LTRQRLLWTGHHSRKGGRPGLAGKFVMFGRFDPTGLIRTFDTIRSRWKIGIISTSFSA